MQNQKKRTVSMLGLLVCLLIASMGYSQNARAGITSRAVVQSSVVDALKSADKVRVIISLHQNSFQIAGAQQALLSALPVPEFRLIHQYSNVPALAGEVTAEGLVALQNNPLVKSVKYDQLVYATINEAAKIGRVRNVQNELGVTGKNVVVAVLDDGIDSDNRDFAGRIIAEKCYSSLSSDCPDGGTESNSANVEATQHGTNVAGIIASNGANGHKGVAPDAKIVAVKVLDNDGVAPFSDIFAGLDWILTNQKTLNIDIINMSLGSAETSSGYCDSQAGEFNDLFKKLKNSGIAIFIASGNGGVDDGVSFPACLSTVIAVGATYDSDLGREPDMFSYQDLAGPSYGDCADLQTSAGSVACFSNSSPILGLFAPGSKITSSGWNNGTTTFSGTSQAAPFAAGVAALVLSANPQLSPDQLLQLLIKTGTTVIDSKNGLSFPLVNAYEAVKAANGSPSVPTKAPVATAPPKTPWPTSTPKANTPWPTSTPKAKTPWPTSTPKRNTPWPTNAPKATTTPSWTKNTPHPTNTPWPTNTPKAPVTTNTPWPIVPTKSWTTPEPTPTKIATPTKPSTTDCPFENPNLCHFFPPIDNVLDNVKDFLPKKTTGYEINGYEIR